MGVAELKLWRKESNVGLQISLMTKWHGNHRFLNYVQVPGEDFGQRGKCALAVSLSAKNGRSAISKSVTVRARLALILFKEESNREVRGCILVPLLIRQTEVKYSFKQMQNCSFDSIIECRAAIFSFACRTLSS